MRALVLMLGVGVGCKDPADDAAACRRNAELQVGCLGGSNELQARMRATYVDACRAAVASSDPGRRAAIRAELECTAKVGSDCDALAECLERGDDRPRQRVPIVAWSADEAAAIAESRRTGRGVVIHFVADWAVPSKELERSLAVPAVSIRLESWIRVRIDVSQGTERDDELQERYGSTTLPALVFVCPDGVVGRIDRALEGKALLAAIPPAC